MQTWYLKFRRVTAYLIRGKIAEAIKQVPFLVGIYTFCLHLIYADNKRHSDKIAVFYLEQGFQDRYLFNVINNFKLSGYDILLKSSWQFYKSSSGSYIYYVFKFLKIAYKSNVFDYKIKIVISDRKSFDFVTKYDKLLILNYRNHDQKFLTVPFSFHPWIYILNKLTSFGQIESFLDILRAKPRSIKILFSGQVFNKMYDQLNTLFPNLINRNELFKSIFNEFGNEIASSKEQYKLQEKRILISSHHQDASPKVWLEFLSSACFFIAPPGFEMPYCHNIIEAMATGVIPILQYNEYFTPSLTHGRNCLNFNSMGELKRCINTALQMDDNEVWMMRKNVIEYYDVFLSPISFIKNIETSLYLKQDINVIAGSYSYK